MVVVSWPRGTLFMGWWIQGRPHPTACRCRTDHKWVYPLDPGMQVFLRGSVFRPLVLRTLSAGMCLRCGVEDSFSGNVLALWR
jgi:hypothetical protein